MVKLFLKFCLRGEILPNLVTLYALEHVLTISLSMCILLQSLWFMMMMRECVTSVNILANSFEIKFEQLFIL